MPETADDNAPAHPTAGLFLILFKGAAMAYYIICGWLPTNFVLNFCLVTFLLVCDFWTVSILKSQFGLSEMIDDAIRKFLFLSSHLHFALISLIDRSFVLLPYR